MTVQKPSYKFATNEGDVAFLTFIRDRLVGKHGEEPDVDYILTLNKMIEGWDDMRENCYRNGFKAAEDAHLAQIKALEQQLRWSKEDNKAMHEQLVAHQTMIRGMTEVIRVVAAKLGESV